MQLLQCTASPPGGGGQCKSSMHYLTARGHWAVQILQYTASLPLGSGQWNSCNALLNSLGAVRSGAPALQYTASALGVHGQ